MDDKKYLGIDWGEAKIGLAIGNESVKVALPLKVVGSLEELLQVIKEENIDQLVIGRPISKHAPVGFDDHPLSKPFMEFYACLKNMTNLPLTMIDERLTTKEADRLIAGGSKKEDQDALAAMLILQSYFDRISNT